MLVDGDDGNTYVLESAVTATFNPTLTRDANSRGKSLAQIIFEQQEAWDDMGFRLIVDDCFGSLP